jgi:hypothetical protein
MKQFVRILCACITVYILNGEVHAATVHLLSALQDNPSAIESGDQIVLTFGSEYIIISNDSVQISNARVLASGIAPAELVVLRDRRPMDQRQGYHVLYSQAGFRLAHVANIEALSSHPDIQILSVTESRVILKMITPRRAEPDPTVTALLSTLSIDKYSAYLMDLAPDDATRYTCSIANQTSRDKIQKHFTDLGLSSSVMPFKAFCSTDCNRQPGDNVIGIKAGATRPQEYVLIGAHYDSISPIACNQAPGANDNASGVAAVMEIARAFSGVSTERSVLFVAFSGEEQGLIGSKYLARVLKNMGLLEQMKGFLILDMISYYKNNYGVIAEGSDHTSEQIAILEEMAQLCATYTPLTLKISTSYSGSDHVPFLNDSLSGCLLIENDWSDYAYYHTVQDTFTYQNMEFGMDVVRLATAFTATHGGLLPQ